MPPVPFPQPVLHPDFLILRFSLFLAVYLSSFCRGKGGEEGRNAVVCSAPGMGECLCF